MKFALLGSGRGSNAEAILRVWRAGGLGSAVPVALFSDKADAPFLRLGESFGVPSAFVDPGPFRTKLDPAAEERFATAVRSAGADWVVLAGFMRVLKRGFLEAFPDRIINLHPSLLPSFKGLHAIRQAWDAGVRVTGCTVHLVSPEVDGGAILDQAAVRVEESDTLESLEAKVHAAEHALLPSVILRLAEGRLRPLDRRAAR
ncbi:MAG: phosphoribosylglycinamide formyltransferase [Opitutales bacterium]|nr:phosphoribosylglycinamide formyltransferase [Opitutales bacterium]